MKYYYEDVPGLGNIAISRHAQDRAASHCISDEMVEDVLINGTDTPDGMDTLWREHNGVRLVIITPTPFRGAKLVKTMYRIQRQASVK